MSAREVHAWVELCRVDGLDLWRVLVSDLSHDVSASTARLRCAWFARWERAQALADLATRAPDHPSLAGVQWTSVEGRPSPRTVAERLAIVGRRASVPRIGLAVGEVCS